MQAIDFNAFARVNPLNNEVLDYPVSIEEVRKHTPITGLTLLINNPPAGFVSVKKTDTSGYVFNDMQKLVESAPEIKNGVWVQVFNVVDKSIEEIDELIRSERRSKQIEIDTARLSVNQGYFLFKGKQIACDRLSRSDIDGTNNHIININIGASVETMPTGWVGGWKSKDNTFVPIPDVATWREMYLMMWNQGNVHFAHAQALKTRIDKAQSLEEIRSINWNDETGFPKIPFN